MWKESESETCSLSTESALLRGEMVWACSANKHENSAYRAQQSCLLRPGATVGVDARDNWATKVSHRRIPKPQTLWKELSRTVAYSCFAVKILWKAGLGWVGWATGESDRQGFMGPPAAPDPRRSGPSPYFTGPLLHRVYTSGEPIVLVERKT